MTPFLKYIPLRTWPRWQVLFFAYKLRERPLCQYSAIFIYGYHNEGFARGSYSLLVELTYKPQTQLFTNERKAICGFFNLYLYFVSILFQGPTETLLTSCKIFTQEVLLSACNTYRFEMLPAMYRLKLVRLC